MHAPIVAVYGATGHTGNFVVRELEHRGIRSVSIGRAAPEPAHAEGAVEWRFAACDAPDALDAALRETSVVINCAGPFPDTAPALIEAALRAGIHYLDITAEQRTARQSLATYHDEAMARGTVVLPAMAFFGGLADLLAADVARGMQAVESIDVAVALDYWHPTRGTRKTGDRNSARRMVVANGQLTPLPQPSKTHEWNFPEPFGMQEVAAVPLSEIVTIHRHIAARNVHSYLNVAPLRDIHDAKTPAPTASDASGRSSQRFVMDVRARAGDAQSRITASGIDIYAVTAPLVVEACLRILGHPPASGGAYAPAELFDAEDFLSALAPHLEITRSRDVAAVA
ncbi:MAG TPA: saccharopine dehydrogenase NADP-binding domain-containing protein [Rhodanobacteraceae bacterium]|nr:saccharopine dehydrogenase NADP-binding domain-containing protein [Rhodanobacteraceae bacterium]